MSGTKHQPKYRDKFYTEKKNLLLYLKSWVKILKEDFRQGPDLNSIALEKNILKAKSLGMVKKLEYYQLEKLQPVNKPTKKVFSSNRRVFIDEALGYVCSIYQLNRQDPSLRGLFRPIDGEKTFMDRSYDYCIKAFCDESTAVLQLFPVDDIISYVRVSKSTTFSPDYLLYLEISYILYIEFIECMDEKGRLNFWNFKEYKS